MVPGQGQVSCTGTVTWRATGNEIVAGYGTVALDETYNINSCSLPIPGFSFVIKNNRYLTSEYLLEVRQETDGTDDDKVITVRDNDPWEVLPVWVEESDDNRHFSHGEYEGQNKHYPYNTWTGYTDGYITFRRMEQTTVPAGTFYCIVVFHTVEYRNDDGSWGFMDQTMWLHPLGLPVKMERYEWDSPVTGQPTEANYNMQLTSINLERGWPTGPYPDIDHNGQVDYADFARFALFWMERNCPPGDRCEGADFDESGNIDFMDLGIFCDNWLVDYGLVAYWSFDDPCYPVRDDSGNGHDGTVHGAVWTTGKVKGALAFDGQDDYIQIPHGNDLNFETGFRIELWFKAASTQPCVGGYFSVIDKSHRGTQAEPHYSGWTLQGEIATGRLWFWLGNGTGFDGVGTQGSVLDDEWHHVAGIVDTSTMQLYLDGRLESASAFSGSPLNNNDPLYMGKCDAASGRNFKGLVDEVAIFNRAWP